MTEHKCAWCGGDPDRLAHRGDHDRFGCKACGEHVVPWSLGILGTNDRDGLNGPETWVDPTQAPAEIRARWEQEAWHRGQGKPPINTISDGSIERVPSGSGDIEVAPPAFKVGDRVVHDMYGGGVIVAEPKHPPTPKGDNHVRVLLDKHPSYAGPHDCWLTDTRLSPAPAEDEPQWHVHLDLSAANEMLIRDLEAQIDGAPTTMDNCRCTIGDSRPQHTHTAVFEFEDGRRVEIPRPGNRWERWCTKGFAADARWGTDNIPRPNHEAFNVWFKDMERVLDEETPRIVSTTEWRFITDEELTRRQKLGRKVYLDGLKYDHCASLHAPSEDWPDGAHPKRVING